MATKKRSSSRKKIKGGSTAARRARARKAPRYTSGPKKGCFKKKGR